MTPDPNPPLHESHRHLVATPVKRFNLSQIRRDLLRKTPEIGDFRTLDTALPAAAKTQFGVYDNGRRILVAVCLRDLNGFAGKTPGPFRDSVEILFNPWNDDIGYEQFLFTPRGTEGPYPFTPYEAAHSSAFRHMRLVKAQWDLPASAQAGEAGPPAGRQIASTAWLFAWFDANEVFRDGATVVGFNLARAPGARNEPATWNPCSGHGMQDATSFGRLYRTAPLAWASAARCRVSGTDSGPLEIRITGRSPARKPLAFRLVDPMGEPAPLESKRHHSHWEVCARLPAPVTGRYRLYAEADGPPPEPRYLAFDLAPTAEAPPFAVAMTYDVPDDILCDPLPYSPEALAAELDLMRRHGIDRIHWIDYPPETLQAPEWTAYSSKSVRTHQQCGGDLLPLAAKLARARGMKFVGIFKPFDLAIDGTNWHEAPDPESSSDGPAVRNLEGHAIWRPAAMARRQADTQAVHPDWLPPADGRRPARFRLYSRNPLPSLTRGEVRLWVSADNRRYQPYRGPMTVRVRRIRRPHQRWTAAGNVNEPTRETLFALELDGLRLKTPYAALDIRADVRLSGRAHAFAEAWDGEGRPLPVTLATRGDREQGFSYWQEWMSWANTSPRMLEDVTWGPGVHGLVFDRRLSQPTLLEPCCEGAQAIWLEHVRRILDTDADGAGIRTLCHHNNVMDYLSMAFHPAVRERFRAEHGRDPDPTWNDAVRVREVRGQAYTDFLRQAKSLAAGAGKTLALHLEAGIEVPPALAQRMQFNLEWETWIREGIADELILKWWFSQNPFIHERVLPLARRHGIPVHIVDRNGSLNQTPRAIERAEALLRDARRAGFAGYAWYEAANCKRRNTENVPEFRAHIGDAILRSARAAATAPPFRPPEFP